MANGIAVGGFAQGLSQGLTQGVNLVSQIDKNKREQEAFEMDKKIKQNQIDEMERKAAMQAQIKADLQALNTNAAGGVTGGQATDEFGTAIGGLQYSSPAQAKASGLSFAAGTTTEAPPMNEFQKNRAVFDIFKKARIDHNFMDEETWKKSMEMTRKLKKEGIEDAFENFLLTGDSDKAISQFNESGTIRAPKGSFLKREVDPNTGLVDVGIYVPGKDGKPQLLTTMNQYMLMTNTDATIKHYAEMRKSGFEQSQANKRTGMEVAGRIDAALIGARGKDSEKKDRVKERIDKYAVDFSGKLISNPSISYNVEEFRRQQPQIAARAYQYMTGRVPGQTVAYDDEALALDQATQDILGKPKK